MSLLESHVLRLTEEVVADHGDDGEGGLDQVALLPLGQEHHGGHRNVAAPALPADHNLLRINIPLVTVLMDVLTQKSKFLDVQNILKWVTFKAS